MGVNSCKWMRLLDSLPLKGFQLDKREEDGNHPTVKIVFLGLLGERFKSQLQKDSKI